MKTSLKVLIADESAQFGKKCQNELRNAGFEVVLTAKDGGRVISVIDSQHFDVVLMDAFMPNGDAIEVLEHMNNSLSEKPLVAILSSIDSQDFEEQMINAGANYYFIKPVNAESVAKRIVSLASWKTEKKKRERTLFSDSDIDVVISDIMRQIGVPAHIKGYQYLRTAIKLSVNDSEMLSSVQSFFTLLLQKCTVQPRQEWKGQSDTRLRLRGTAEMWMSCHRISVIRFSHREVSPQIRNL